MTAGASRRWGNFDAIRLIAATTVVLSHSFMIGAAGYDSEPFVRVFGQHHDMGLMAVGAFFVISGFLITQSFLTRASTLSYLLNRILRIFPGLIVCTVVTTLVLGPFFAPSAWDFVTGHDTWAFIGHTASLQQFSGMNFPVHLYPEANGTMFLVTTWTLPAEFQCYLILLIVGSLGMLRLPTAVAMLAFGLWSFSHWNEPFLEAMAVTIMYFGAGSALYFVHAKWRPTAPVLVAAVAGFSAMAVAGWPMEGFALFGSVLLIQLATSERVTLPKASRYGDLSYGVYLYGFPIQQASRAAWGPSITWWQDFLVAMPLALGCAWLSWHLVESRALALARRYRRSVQEQTTASPVAASAPASA